MSGVNEQIKKGIKIAEVTLGIFVLLLTIAIYSLRFPSVQDYLITKALNYYKNKVSTHASIGRLYIGFPSNITVEDLYLEDQQSDTLLYIKYLTARTNLWSLINRRIRLGKIEVDGLTANINRIRACSLSFRTRVKTMRWFSF